MDKIRSDIRNDIQSFRQGGHRTRELLVTSKVGPLHLDWAMKELNSSCKQTEWVNHWIAKMRLCEDTVDILAGYILKYCEAMKKVLVLDEEPARKNRLLQHNLNLFYEACQGLGITVHDYFDIIKLINSNINKLENDFVPPIIRDPEEKVSERLAMLNNEIEKFLLANPNENILGFSSLRTFFESFVLILSLDKIRAYIRIKENNNKIEAKFSDDLKREDVFYILKTLFPDKIKDSILFVLNRLYDNTSASIHRGTTTPAYLIWTSWDFLATQLKPEFDQIDTSSNERLGQIASKFKKEEKLLIW